MFVDNAQVEYELDFGGEAVDASAVFEMAFTELQEGRRDLATVRHSLHFYR